MGKHKTMLASEAKTLKVDSLNLYLLEEYERILEDKMNLTDLSKAELKKKGFKIGSSVRLKRYAEKRELDIQVQFSSNEIGGVIISPTHLESAIRYYLVGLGVYTSASIIELNNGADGEKPYMPGALISFKFKDGGTLEGWYSIRDLTKKKR